MANALANTTNINTMLAQDAGTTYCSIEIDPNDRKSAARVFDALNNPAHMVSEYINKSINVSNVLIEVAEVVSEDTGEMVRAPRVVLIDEEGVSYQAISVGMFTAVKNAFRCFGAAPWEPALVFDIKQKPVKNGSMLTANVH